MMKMFGSADSDGQMPLMITSQDDKPGLSSYKGTQIVAWENSRHFATPPLVSLRNDCTNSILITCHFPDVGSASDLLKICSNQSEALPRSGGWRVISMEFLPSSLSGGCFLRLLKLPQMRHGLVIISHVEVACKLPFHSVISRVFKEYCIFCRSTPCPVQCLLWDKSSWWQVWPESCSVFTASQSYLWCGK